MSADNYINISKTLLSHIVSTKKSSIETELLTQASYTQVRIPTRNSKVVYGYWKIDLKDENNKIMFLLHYSEFLNSSITLSDDVVIYV